MTATAAGQAREMAASLPSPVVAADPAAPQWRVLPLPGRRTVAIRWVLDAGASRDLPGRGGSSQVLADVITLGPPSADAEVFLAGMEMIGGSVRASADHHGLTVETEVIRENLDEALERLQAALAGRWPDPKRFATARTDRVAQLKALQTVPGIRAHWGMRAAVHGADSPFGHPAEGTTDSLAAISEADVGQLWGQGLTAPGPTLVVAGDVAAEIVESASRRLWETAGSSLPGPARPAPERVSGPDLVIENIPGAGQSLCGFGAGGLRADAQDVAALKVAVRALAGSFGSRLNQKLRQRQGVTYGVHGLVDHVTRGSESVADFGITVAVQTAATGHVVETVLGELSDIAADGFRESEIIDAIGGLIGSIPVQMTSTATAASVVSGQVARGQPADATARMATAVAGLSPDRVSEAARTYLRPEDVVVVVAGDASEVENDLRQRLPTRRTGITGTADTPGIRGVGSS